MTNKIVCEYCKGTGWYGDNGPGIRGNEEYHQCDYCDSDKIKELERVFHDALDEIDRLKARLIRSEKIDLSSVANTCDF